MNREAGRFLLETWQLFYWSLFFPSKLRHRIDDWSQGNEKELLAKDNPPNSSFLRYSPRFILQHLFLSAILSFPLASLVVPSGDWLIYLIALLLSYSWNYLNPLLSAIGFVSSFLLALIYWQQPNFLFKLIGFLSKPIQFFFHLLTYLPLISPFSTDVYNGIFASIVILFATFLLADFSRSLRINNFLSVIILSGGSGLSVVIGSWIASQNLLITTFLTIFTITIICILLTDILPYKEKYLQEKKLGIAGEIAGEIVGVLVGILVSFLVLVVMMTIVSRSLDNGGSTPDNIVLFFANVFILIILLPVGAIAGAISHATTATFIWLISCLTDILFLRIGLTTSIIMTFILCFCIGLSFALIAIIPLHWFLVTCSLVAFSCAPLKNKFLGFIIAAIFVVLGSDRLSLNALWAIPVSLISYYRILPDYLWSYSISLISTKSSLKWFHLKSATLLEKLPPYTTELLWFPVPNHSQILEAAFHQDPDLGIATFKKMQVISLPGFQSTIDKAFPIIAPYLFIAVNTTANLIDSVTSEQPLFPLLSAASSKSHEIKILFPILQEVANDTRIALQSGNSALRERSLGSLVNRLKQILAELPGMRLKPQSVKPWRLVIERWQYILEQEIAEQQRIYQREREFAEQQRIQREREFAEQQRIQRERELTEQQRIQRERELAEQQRIQREREFAEQQRIQREREFAEQQRIQREREFAEQQRIQRERELAEQQKISQRERELAEQQKISQGELLNPFQFGNPLNPDHTANFKGRQDFADRLRRLILDRNRPTLVLHGPRRTGKTSFLLNLPRLLPSDLVPIYLDMQQGSMNASEGDFCYGLVRAIEKNTRSQGFQLPPIPSRIDFRARPYPTLEDWLDLLLPQLGDRRLLLNLDEFEKIGSAIEEKRISERLFDQLRSMIQHYDRLGFLFSGVQTLEELGPRWSNYFISVVPMEMHYLESREAEDLLRDPDPKFTLRYDTGIVDEILRLTRCQPYLLQLIGSALVNQANLQHTKLATTTLLQAAIQDALTNGQAYFTNIWTEFTGTTPAEVTAGKQILIALAQGKSPRVTNDISEIAARHRLWRYHVIECLDRDLDRIEIPLFEQWVRERAIKP